MILGGTPFIRTSCFVVGSVVLVSLALVVLYLEVMFNSPVTVHKLDYHGPEEGEEQDHH